MEDKANNLYDVDEMCNGMNNYILDDSTYSLDS